MVVSLRDALFPLVVLLVVARYIAKRSSGASRFPLPPGPKGLPLLGTALSIDAAQPWVTYVEWGTSFGDLIYTRILNMDVLIINSAKVARDLLELRSTKYSDRPQLATVGHRYGIETGTIFMPYGDTWRLHRRIYHQALNPEASLNYRPMQLRKARQMLVNLVGDSKCFPAHLYTYSTSVIMSIVYGHNPAPTNDPLVEFAEKGMEAIVKAARPETAALLKMFPFLLKLPTWMPGSFKAEAAQAKQYADDFRRIPFRMVKEKMASGTDTPSMVSNAIRNNESKGNLPEVTDAIINTSPVAYGAASDTTAFSLQVFVLTMVLFPEAQRKAQKEIDAVVGRNRLPNFDDRPSLPYVEALMRESSRWHPVAPLAVPHATTTEDVYEGMYIPKGLAIAHNEETYPEPFQFLPERFLKEDGTLTEDNVPYAFGFGRRICPGKYVADASLWIAIVSMLALFDFLKEKDEQGNDIDFQPKFTSEVTSRPEPFPCRIIPRRSASDTKELAMQDFDL
ncbi:cytochrome P450 [Gyrodon lividus]|nr:cytochrome P450 [Gyrodon lividus]